LSTGAFADFLTIDDLAHRLQMSKKTLKDLKRTDKFPLRRITPRGTAYVFWSEVELWLRTGSMEEEKRQRKSGQGREEVIGRMKPNPKPKPPPQ
jgi:hypothetical protein